MCFSKPAAQQNQSQNQQQMQSVAGQINSVASQLPTPETAALYQMFLAQALNNSQQPFDLNTLGQIAPWTDALNQAVNQQWSGGLAGQQMPAAISMIGGAGQSTTPQVADLAQQFMNPYGPQAAQWGQQYGGQAAQLGQQYGQQAMDWGTSQGQAIADYAKQMQQAAPQFQQFSQAAVDQYLSPYINDVVDATQAQFNNANAIQSSSLLGQGIKAGNAFGGDRAGVAQGILANQQQLAQAPVIAGLYNQGYLQALNEYNVQNQLAAQMAQLGLQGQTAGAQLGLQGITGGGALGLQGTLGGGQLGLQGLSTAQQGAMTATQQALQSLAQNQNAGLQAGSLLGNLSLASGPSAIQAAQVYPGYVQSLLNQQQQNAQAVAAYPFQTSGWFGSLLGGIGPLTGQIGAQSQNSSQIANTLANMYGSTTQPSNTLNNILGLGSLALGLLKRGGTVGGKYASGGEVSEMPYSGASVPYRGGRGYVPQRKTTAARVANLLRQEALRAPSMPSGRTQWLNLGKLPTSNPLSKSSVSKARSGLQSLSSSVSRFFEPTSGMSTALDYMDSGWSGSDFAPGAAPYRKGGIVDMRFRNGGWYDDGGGVESEDYQYPSDEEEPDTGLERTDDEEDESIPENAREMAGSFAAAPSAVQQQALAQGATPRLVADISRLRQQQQQQQPQRWTDRWLSNPMTQIGLGLLGSQNTFTGIARGLQNVQAQRAADRAEQVRLDKDWQLDNSGETQKIRMGSQLWDLGLPTERALERQTREARAQQQRLPAGYRKAKDSDDLEPIPGGPADPVQIQRKSEAKAFTAQEGQPGVLTEDDARGLAMRFFESGNRMEITNLGHGKVGTQNRALVQRYINWAIKERAGELGTTETQERAEFTQRQAEWEGRKAGQRALGTMEARMGTAAEEARGAIDLARGAIDKVPRTDFLPLNTLIQGYQNQTLSPEQRQLFVYTQGVINAYAAVMNRGANVTTDASRHRAEELLRTADNPAAYNASLNALGMEIDRARLAPKRMREMYRELYGADALSKQKEPLPIGEGSSAKPFVVEPPAQRPALPPRDQLENGKVYPLPDGRKGKWNSQTGKFSIVEEM